MNMEDIKRGSASENITLLIAGGTGSFGHTVLKHFLYTDIYRRDKHFPDGSRADKYIIGTINMLQEAIEADMKRVVCLSTDKAYSINAMGTTRHKCGIDGTYFLNERGV